MLNEVFIIECRRRIPWKSAANTWNKQSVDHNTILRIRWSIYQVSTLDIKSDINKIYKSPLFLVKEYTLTLS